MRRVKTLGLILTAVVFRLAGWAAEDSSVPVAGAESELESAERVLTLMRDAQADVTSLVAAIEQVKSYPQLGIEDPPERGRLFLMNGDRADSGRRVHLEIQEPEIRLLTIQNGHYLLYHPRIKQAVRGRLTGGGKTSMFSGILTGSSEAVAALGRDYDVARVDDDVAASIDAYRLLFTARAGAVVFCHRIALWIDKKTFLPVRQACHEANESVLTFTLSDISLDASIDDDVFDIELPEDVTLLES